MEIKVYRGVSSEKVVIYRTMADTKFFTVGVPKESRQKERAGRMSLTALERKKGKRSEHGQS